MYLGDQWTGGIKDLETSATSLILDCLGDTVGAENYDYIIRHFVQLIDKYRTPGAQVIHHKLVVDHLVADIDRGAKHFQSAIDYIDSAIDTGTETPRVG